MNSRITSFVAIASLTVGCGADRPKSVLPCDPVADPGCIEVNPNAADSCGDRVCGLTETQESCPDDCLNREICGNLRCAGEENPGSCPQDCTGSCGDGTCQPTESPNDCARDCAGGVSGVCSDGQCVAPENPGNCPADCGITDPSVSTPSTGGTPAPGSSPSTPPSACNPTAIVDVNTPNANQSYQFIATTSGSSSLSGGCATTSNSAPEKVFKWKAPASGIADIRTCGSGFDTVVYMRAGTCTGPEMDGACNDDASGCVGGGSRVSHTVSQNVTYYIVVDGRGASQMGSVRLEIKTTTTTPASTEDATVESGTGANLACSGLPARDIALNGAVTLTYQNTDTTTGTSQLDYSPTCGGNLSGPEKVYKWQATQSGTAEITVSRTGAASNLAPVVSVFEGTCKGSQVRCSDTLATGSFGVTAGKTYYVVVDGKDGTTGTYLMNLIFQSDSTAVSSGQAANVCATAEPLTITGSTIRTVQLSGASELASSCGASTGPEKVFRWTAPSNGHLDLGIASTSTTPVVAVRRGTCMGAVDAKCVAPNTQAPSLAVSQSQTYYIIVDSPSALAAEATLSLGFRPAPASTGPVTSGASCADAKAVLDGKILEGIGADLVGGSGNLKANCDTAGNRSNGPEKVYTFTPSQPGTVSISATPNFAAAVYVKVGVDCAIGDFVPNACVMADQGANAELSFPVLGGQHYYMVVDSAAGSTGGTTRHFDANIHYTAQATASGVPAPPTAAVPTVATPPAVGQDCSSASIVREGTRIQGSTVDAGNYYQGSCSAFFDVGDDGAERVYRWVPETSGYAVLDTCNSDYDTKLYVREGADACESDSSTVACALDGCYGSAGSRFGMMVTAGQVYHVFVDGSYDGGGDNDGSFNLNIQVTPTLTLKESTDPTDNLKELAGAYVACYKESGAYSGGGTLTMCRHIDARQLLTSVKEQDLNNWLDDQYIVNGQNRSATGSDFAGGSQDLELARDIAGVSGIDLFYDNVEWVDRDQINGSSNDLCMWFDTAYGNEIFVDRCTNFDPRYLLGDREDRGGDRNGGAIACNLGSGTRGSAAWLLALGMLVVVVRRRRR